MMLAGRVNPHTAITRSRWTPDEGWQLKCSSWDFCLSLFPRVALFRVLSSPSLSSSSASGPASPPDPSSSSGGSASWRQAGAALQHVRAVPARPRAGGRPGAGLHQRHGPPSVVLPDRPSSSSSSGVFCFFVLCRGVSKNTPRRINPTMGLFSEQCLNLVLLGRGLARIAVPPCSCPCRGAPFARRVRAFMARRRALVFSVRFGNLPVDT